jgi:tRNA U38,U39,U40 pseudouridine synthase TruA
VGTLLALNDGRISMQEFIDLIQLPEKGKSHFKARACGLYLLEVQYKDKKL